jgi:carboxypeptidase PM20D1
MRILLKSVLLALLLLTLVVLTRALLIAPPLLNTQPVELPAGLDAQRAAQSLSAAIQLPTLSLQEGADAQALAASSAAFAQMQQWLAEHYPRLSAAVIAEPTGSASLLLRWPGQDRQLPPVLLMAHMDVVPVAPDSVSQWQYPPFAGQIADGFVWGRGALDSKGSMVAMLEAAEALLTQGFTPQRDVLLAFGHDEEIGGQHGNQAIAQQLYEQGTRLAWVNDEGGFIVRGQIPGVSQDVAVVGVAEKGYVSLQLHAESSGGHSSQPPAFADTAIGRLSLALQKIGAAPFPRDLQGPTGALLESFTPAQSFGYRLIFANLWLFGPLVQDQLGASPAGAAQMQTSLAPTLLQAGVKENVLPSSASATLNLRIHPHDSIASVTAHVQAALADQPVSLTVLPGGREPSAVSDINSSTYQQFAEVIRQSFSHTLVSPNLTVGGTDSRYYEPLSANVFRFSPLLMEREDLARMHGSNERVAIANLANACGFYYRLLHSLK